MDLSEFMNGGDHWLLAGYCEKSESGSDEGRGRCRGYAHR